MSRWLARIAILVSVGCGVSDEPVPSQRNPSTGECEASRTGTPDPAWPACSGACSQLDEAACLSAQSCHGAYVLPRTDLTVYWGCWEMPASGSTTGSCEGLDANACSTRSDCVSKFETGSNFRFLICSPKP